MRASRLLALVAAITLAVGPAFAGPPAPSPAPFVPAPSTASGDITCSSSFSCTVAKIQGQTPGPFALGTDAGNLTGILSPARIAAGSIPTSALVDAAKVNSAVQPGGAGDTLTVSGRTLAARAADTINVKDAPYSAKGDTIAGFTDGTIAAGSKAFSSQSATFQATDVGKLIVVDGAGPSNAPLVTTITSYVDSHNVVLAASASNSTPYIVVNNLTISSAGTGGYAPGDTITPVGGSSTTAASASVRYTKVGSASVANAGSGGTAGSCVLTGTTGSQVGAQAFTINATISAGAISALGSILTAGTYAANPTTPSAEPVTSSCGLTGATLSLSMIPAALGGLSGGIYSVPPSSPASTTTSGSGSGLTVSISTTAPTWKYGTDDTAAWSTAITKSQALNAAGTPACIYAPGGVYSVTPGLPLATANLCVRGDGEYKSYISLTPNTAGDLFSCSNCISGGKFNGTTFFITPATVGATFKDFTVVGYRSSTANQNAIVLYDQDDQVYLSNISAYNIKGRVFYAGSTKNSSASYFRESTISNFKAWLSGDTNLPVFEITSMGAGDASNEINGNDINIYAPYGTGILLDNAATAKPLRQMRFSKVRVEGQEGNPANVAADLIAIGTSASTAANTAISFTQTEMVSAYSGYSAFHLVSNGLATTPSNISLQGDILGGFGGGIRLDNASNFYARLGANTPTGFGLYVAPSATISAPIIIDPNGNFGSWTTSIDTSSKSLVFSPLAATPRGTGAFALNTPDGTVLGGNAGGAGSINLNTTRGAASQVPSGAQAVLVGGSSNTASGAQSSVVGGLNTVASGLGSGAVACSGCTLSGPYSTGTGSGVVDSGRTGLSCLSSNKTTGVLSQNCAGLLKASSSSTSAVRLTTDGATASSSTCFSIPANTTYNLRIAIVGHDKTTTGTWYSWTVPLAVLHRDVAASTTTATLGTPSTLAAGTTSGTAVSATADTTNACLNLSVTPPSTDAWDWVARVESVEAQ